jgi:hypothetical protein
MSNFHGTDPNLLVNALRLILEGFKTLRSEKGQPNPEKREEVLEETIEKARELSAEGVGADKVASEIETRLEHKLGRAAKDEIIGRVTSILTLAQPFDLEAFRYFENLSRILARAQTFCVTSNIFKLRGRRVENWGYELLLLPKTGLALRQISNDFDVLTTALCGQRDVIGAHVSKALAFLRTGARTLHIGLALDVDRAFSMGGSSTENKHVTLCLTSGSEVNRVGFDVVQPTSVSALPGLDLRLTATEFHALVSALLEDLNGYTKELADEEQTFRNQVAPALDRILAEWTKL